MFKYSKLWYREYRILLYSKITLSIGFIIEYSQVLRDYFGDDLEAVDAAHQSHKAYLANGGTVSIEDWFYRASTNIDYLTIEG